jgi:pimeloyl-ACP methyl ester carboxylesterase
MTPRSITSVFVENGPVRLHALDTGAGDESSAPVLVVPGFGEYADEYRWLADALAPRRVVVVDVRGRGRSDVPDAGYTWEDHYGDVGAVATARALDRPVVVAFSRGSSYALGHALAHPDSLRGLVVGDYFARHVGLPLEFAEQQLASKVRGTPVSERMEPHAVRRVFAEGREVPLWERLGELRVPVMVLRGTRRSALVTDEIAAQWRSALPRVELVTIPDAGHDLWSRDVDAYLAALGPFLTRIDGGSNHN